MKRAFLILLATLVGLFACVIPASAEEAPAHPEPIAWYTFDDPENLGADTSGNDNNLRLKGNPAYNELGVYDGCLYLDGASALVARNDDNGLDFLDKLQNTTGQFTLTYWMKATREDFASFDPSQTWRRIVSNGMDFSGQGGFTVINNPDNNGNPSVFYSNPFVEYNNGYWASTLFPADTPFSEDWIFITVSMDAKTNTIKYYVNGILLTTLTPDMTDGGKTNASSLKFARANCPLAFGAHYYNDGTADRFFQSYKGALDQVGVFDTLLSESDIFYYMKNRREEASNEGTVNIGKFFEGENVVFRFDSVRDITKSISSYSYVEVGMLDKSAKLKFWGDMPLVQKKLDTTDAFPLEEYPFLKIKYCCRTENPKTVFMFATTNESDLAMNDALTFEHQNEVWEEKTFDMSALNGWNGRLTEFQLLPTPLCDDDSETFFIEYLAFFKTQEAADAFGGLTAAQKEGTDPVSLYYSRGYVNPYLGYPAVEQIAEAPEDSMLPWLIGGAAGVVVLLVVTALITAAIVRKKYKSKK